MISPRTPTLHAVATGDEQQLVEDLQERVEAAILQAAETPRGSGSSRGAAARNQHFLSLQKAERALNQFAKIAGEKLVAMREAALDAVIQSAAGGDKLDFKGLSELASLESRSRQATRAIERLVERLLPLALWTRLGEESHAAITHERRALEGVAQERAERVLDQLREAVGEEMILPVEYLQRASTQGALLAQARDIKTAWSAAFGQRGFN